MTNPKVSLIVTLDKTGGIDILADSLLRQTFTDFEVLLVDEIYSSREGIIESYLKRKGVKQNILHMPEELRKHKYKFGYCSAVNSAIARSRGEIILQLGDYMWMPPKYIEKHLLYQIKYPGLISGHKVFSKAPHLGDPTNPISIYEEEFVFEKNLPNVYSIEPEIKKDFVSLIPKVPFRIPLMCPEVMSIPIEILLKVNGYDESYDLEFAGQPWDLTHRIQLAGYSAYLIKGIWAYHYDHVHYKKFPELPKKYYYEWNIVEKNCLYYAKNPYDLSKLRGNKL